MYPLHEKLLSPSRKQLMGVCLMAHIPYNSVFGRVVDVMKRNGEFNYS